MAKKTITKLKKELDKLIKDIIKKRDQNICQRCGKKVEGSNCHGAHVIPVSAGNKLRWDALNLITLCMYDHMQFWHKNPIDATIWFKHKFPERYEYLQFNRGIIQMKEHDFIELRDQLKKELNETNKKRD